MMLVRLMYASRAVPSIDHDELHAILRQSKHNNPQHGITGLLCFVPFFGALAAGVIAVRLKGDACGHAGNFWG